MRECPPALDALTPSLPRRRTRVHNDTQKKEGKLALLFSCPNPACPELKGKGFMLPYAMRDHFRKNKGCPPGEDPACLRCPAGDKCTMQKGGLFAAVPLVDTHFPKKHGGLRGVVDGAVQKKEGSLAVSKRRHPRG